MTDPDSGLFVKGEHKRQFAYEAHTACDKHGFILETVVTPGNVHDSVAFDEVYDRVVAAFPEMETIVADSAYKTPHICKKVFEDGRVLSTAYKRPQTLKGGHQWWKYVYDEHYDCVLCPEYQVLTYRTKVRVGAVGPGGRRQAPGGESGGRYANRGLSGGALVPSLYALRADGRETFLRVPQEGPVLIPSYLCARASAPEWAARRVAERILSRELCDFYAANGDLIVYPACTGRRSGQEADYALCPSAAWLEHLSHVDFYRLYCTKLPSAIEFAYA